MFDVVETLAHNLNIEVDDAKIAAMVENQGRLLASPPPIFVVDRGLFWLIDGHHRLRALHRLGKPSFLAYVVEENDATPYRIYFNGQRTAPWLDEKRNN